MKFIRISDVQPDGKVYVKATSAAGKEIQVAVELADERNRATMNYCLTKLMNAFALLEQKED